jgi:DNA-binding CsgD family transcriptional regulator
MNTRFKYNVPALLVIIAGNILFSCTNHSSQPHPNRRKTIIHRLQLADSAEQVPEQIHIAQDVLQSAIRMEDDSLRYSAMQKLGQYNLSLQNDSAFYYFTESRNGFRRLQMPERALRSEAGLVNFYTRLSEFTKASDAIFRAEQLIRKTSHPTEDRIYYYLQKTIFYHTIGFPDSALQVVNKAEALCDKTGNKRYRPNLKATRAILYAVFGDDRKALREYQSVVSEFGEYSNDRAIILTNIGNKFTRLKQADSALVFYNKALAIHTKRKVGEAVINKLYCAAAFAFLEADLAYSRMYFNRIDSAQLNLPNKFYYSYVKAQLAPTDAERINRLNSAIDFAIRNNIPLKDLEKDCHYELFLLYQKTGNHAAALNHYRLYSDINNQIRGDEALLKVEQLNLMSGIREKELKIANQKQAIAQKNATIEQQRINGLLMIVLSVVTLLILLLVLLNYRKKMRISELLLSQTKLERELLISDVNPIAAQVEQAAVIIRDLKNKVDMAELQVSGISLKPLKTSMQDWLLRNKEQNILLQAHKETELAFLQKVDALTELSATEKRIVILIRQGLQSKDIASRLHLALNTVEIYRSRIRKKLQLAPGEQLNDFIQTLGNQLLNPKLNN